MLCTDSVRQLAANKRRSASSFHYTSVEHQSTMADQDNSDTASLFVYGTLIHPAILSRVLAGSLSLPPSQDEHAHRRNSEITVVPAVLPGYEIRRVTGQEYPALLKVADGAAAAAASASSTTAGAKAVRGVVVHGLSSNDIRALDRFEGDEYVRQEVRALVPSNEEPVSNLVRSSWNAETVQSILKSSLPAERVQPMLRGDPGTSSALEVQAYVWIAGEDELDDDSGPRGPWVFSEFAKSRSSRWTSGEWSDEGGPDGLAVDGQRTGTDGLTDAPSNPGPRPGGSGSGFEEIQRSLSFDKRGQVGGSDYQSSSFSTLSFGADPWADPPAGQSTSHREAGVGSNPWGTEEPSASSGSKLSSNTPRPPPGFPLELEGQEAPGFERFGKPCRRLWYHGDAPPHGGRPYLNLNNGSFGSCPKPVMEAFQALAQKAEENPDVFRRRTYPNQLKSILSRLAERFNVPAPTLALIHNTTTGTNAILRSFPWEQGDHVLAFTTVYGALDKTMDFVSETHPFAPVKIKIDVKYPRSHDEVVAAFETRLKQLKESGKRVRIAMFDAVTSHPGVVVPWERLTAICKQHGVLSLVDGAHAMGQLPVDLGAVQPDFFVTNAHKWSFAHRGCAVLYVPLANQSLVPTSLPTSWGFRTAEQRKSAPEKQPGDDWFAMWKDPGTDDVSSILSLGAALDFVQDRLGGEERVRRYNRSLALLGGWKVAQALGTEILENVDAVGQTSSSGDGKKNDSGPSLTASMVSVRLPLVSRAIGTDASYWLWSKGGEAYFFDTLADEFATNIPVLAHGNQVYARLSAQVWLDLDDFEYAAGALKEVCRRINEGEALGDR
ncbi:unnamed protein product [Jaminaea pallidilutea]